MKETKLDRSRRNVLKALGSTAAVTGLGASKVSGNKGTEFDQLYRDALKIRRRTGKRAPFVAHLRQNGAVVAEQKIPVSFANDGKNAKESVTIPGSGPGSSNAPLRFFDGPSALGDGIAPLRFGENDLEINLTLSQYSCEPNYAYFDYEWEWVDKTSGDEYFGEDPFDCASVHWGDSDYSREAGSRYTSENVYCGDNYGDLDPNGLAVEYDDRSDSYTSTSDYVKKGHFGLKAYRSDQSEPADTRLMIIDYRHWFDSIDVTGISISSGGLSYSIDEVDKEEDYTGQTDWSKHKDIVCGP